MNDSTDQHIDQHFEVGVIGGGSGAEALLRTLSPSGRSVVIFEPRLIGGECPFVACMPSKAMLHDAHVGSTWSAAVDRRDEVVSHLDDSGHRDEAVDLGATIVRHRARLTAPHVVEAGGSSYRCDHVVIATGAVATTPDIEGLDDIGERRWQSEDALTARERPGRMLLIGGGVIGCELAEIYAGFGTTVTMVDPAERALPDLHPRISGLVERNLRDRGVEVRYGSTPRRLDATDDGVVATIEAADGSTFESVYDVVVVATGRRPNTDGIGLDELALELDDTDLDSDDLDVDGDGRVAGLDWLWAIGDAAGGAQYTHVANRQATVVGRQICGDGTATFEGTTVPGCVFVSPPVITVGPSRADLDAENDQENDGDVFWVDVELDGFPRQITDDLPTGFLSVAARRSTGTIVAAHGVGPRFDELTAALTIAIDAAVPVSVLVRTLQPFPTVGEVLGVAFSRVADELG